MYLKYFSSLLTFVFIFLVSFTVQSDVQQLVPKERILVVSCSLKPQNRGLKIAQDIVQKLKTQNKDVQFVDLQNYILPLANGHDQSAYDDPKVKEIHDEIVKAKAIVLVSPIYNYSVSSVTKNLIDLTGHKHRGILSGDGWNGKVVSFVGISGSPASLMAPLSFLNSVMLSFKSIITPNYVMVSAQDFDRDKASTAIEKRIDEMLTTTVKLLKVLE